MGKKLMALAIVGAAAWLFKTKKGNEVRQQLGKKAGEIGGQLRNEYNKYKGGAEPLQA